ncbi:hypothetical protein EUGRSUZ_D01476 [Eucalyptus grandis]|uniref:MATH domain-containing protein n=1 Tax=Eucalyptus grandis TaxID=71139 RepID=A0A059CGS0_EUCGR|nr:hypothetical protein EUGRSUZ_D01476 [Eucalyptus grandis]
MYVEAKLRAVNRKDRKKDKEETVCGWLSAENYYCCCPKFMPWKDLKERNGGFVKNKELKFEVEILVISNAVQSYLSL